MIIENWHFGPFLEKHEEKTMSLAKRNIRFKIVLERHDYAKFILGTLLSYNGQEDLLNAPIFGPGERTLLSRLCDPQLTSKCNQNCLMHCQHKSVNIY